MSVLYSAKSTIISKKTKDGWVILNPDIKSYRQLNSTADFIWNLLQKPVSIDAISQKLTSTYKIDPKTAHDDVSAFIDSYFKLKLLDKTVE